MFSRLVIARCPNIITNYKSTFSNGLSSFKLSRSYQPYVLVVCILESRLTH